MLVLLVATPKLLAAKAEASTDSARLPCYILVVCAATCTRSCLKWIFCELIVMAQSAFLRYL